MSHKKSSRLLLSKQDTWVRPYFKKYRGLLALVLFLGLLTFFSASALMFTSGYLISRSTDIGLVNLTRPPRPDNVMRVYVPIVLTRAFGIGRPTFRYLERLGSHNWVLKMTSDIRLRLYRSLESRAAHSKESFQTGRIMGILAEDIEHIQNLYLRTIFPTIIGLLLYTLVVIGLGCFSWLFALFILLMFGVMVIVVPLASVAVNNARVYRRKYKRHAMYQQLTDAVLGVGDWQYSGRQADFLTRYTQAEKEVRVEDASLNKQTRVRNFITQLLFGIIIVAMFYWASDYFLSRQQANWIAAFVLAVFPLMDAFGPISEGITETPMYEDSVQRLHELPEVNDDTQATTTATTALPVSADIQLEEVSYRYHPQSRELLTSFNLTIPAGQKIAVLGKSGTGKTTLSKLIRGDLTPVAGQITIGGIPVSELHGQMSQVIGVLNQAPHLFDTTLMNNVRLGNLNASDEDVLKAIEQAGLKELVDSLPEGAHTMVEEGGKRFSGGEQQRIALARILLQDVPIVIIDEPTIGLDPITERALLATVFSVLKGKTIIWITHHLMSIEQADRVIFLEDGQLKMDGTPADLRAENEHYQHLLSLDYLN
ncbi:thiol reductant ABC exporter subunit CydC [Vagococcus lutrae]|uniref:thiol reductant ABC exporter subunit CydC n=1 Tax=Vagococcus lutrae TaxID=81947 RepID=UPI00209749C5|nr:thiol reductant ABC exporter subunit CydC [Vagococcus lutrae]